MLKKNVIIFFLLLLLSNIFAATTGNIAGKVFDEFDKPIVYANIVFEDFSMVELIEE